MQLPHTGVRGYSVEHHRIQLQQLGVCQQLGPYPKVPD